jgi:hypothetical protein
MLDNKKIKCSFFWLIVLVILMVILIAVNLTKDILKFTCFHESRLCVKREIKENLWVEFPDENRYFPKIIFQTATPVFLWDNFSHYNKDFWGDNQNGKIEIVSNGKLSGLLLKEKQMVWLLYRLHFGILEFRWLKLGDSIKQEKTDKFFGFGDPNEGFAAGFRLKSLKNQKPQLLAETINFGQIHSTPVKWDEDFKNARYFIDWQKGLIRYSIITSKAYKMVATHVDKNISFVGLPKGRMEISIQNFSGKSKIRLPLVKYDAYD